MRPTAALVAAALALPWPAPAAEKKPGIQLSGGTEGAKAPCRLRVGPGDRVAQDADLIIPPGAEVESAFTLRGSIVVQRGARVKKAVAAGGSVRVESGGRITEEAVAISGDVQVASGGRIDGDVVALGGQVKVADGGQVGGNVVGLSLQLSGVDLERELRRRIGDQARCVVEKESRD